MKAQFRNRNRLYISIKLAFGILHVSETLHSLASSPQICAIYQTQPQIFLLIALLRIGLYRIYLQFTPHNHLLFRPTAF